MATYTLAPVTFTTNQEAGLDRKLAYHNQGRTSQTPPLPAHTKQEYLDGLAQAWPVAFVAEFRIDLVSRCQPAMMTANVTELTTVTNTLGVVLNPYAGGQVPT